MNDKTRRYIYELIALCLTGFFGAFALPELVNAHNSVALLAGGILFITYLCWFASFIYRGLKSDV
jgi:heme A synthase